MYIYLNCYICTPLRFIYIRPFPRGKHPQLHYTCTIVHPSAYKPPACEPAEQFVMDIRSGYPRRTQGFSVTSPRTSLASGKLPTRRISLFPVPAISTSKVAGLGWDSLLYSGGSASLYQSVACADRPHNPTYRTIQHLSLLGFTTQSSYIFEYIVKSISQHIEMLQTV